MKLPEVSKVQAALEVAEGELAAAMRSADPARIAPGFEGLPEVLSLKVSELTRAIDAAVRGAPGGGATSGGAHGVFSAARGWQRMCHSLVLDPHALAVPHNAHPGEPGHDPVPQHLS